MKDMSLLKSILPALVALLLLPGTAGAAPPDLAVGDVFVYAGSAPQPAEPPTDGQPRMILAPRPVQQTIRVLEETPCGDATCLLLEAEQTLPTYGMQKEGQANTARRWARMDKETGHLVELELLMQVGGQELRRKVPVKSKNSLFADFYGTWMLDVAEGWSAEFDLNGNRKRRYAVTGQESVAGRPCFVVQRTTPQQDGSVQETTFWIDRDRRVAVQVQEGDWKMVLQETKRRSG